MIGDQPPELKHLTAVPLGGPPPGAVAFSGTDLEGRACGFDPHAQDQPTLLLFLGGHCDGCEALAGLLDGEELPGGLGVVGILPAIEDRKGSGTEAFEGRRALVLRSPAAFAAYRVGSPPFFSLVVPAAPQVVAEGVPLGVADLLEQVSAHLS